MFEKIFIENEYKNHVLVEKIQQRFKSSQISYIEDINQIFGKVKKPYLHKRNTLNLFLGSKKGQLVKEAPDAYGIKGDKHYYFIHAYNCIYECEYCYLQGYFHSPDIVVFLNKEEIQQEIFRLAKLNTFGKTSWFHAGEFSDSLALSHLTDEIDFYYETFEKIPDCKLELRTKSINIKKLLELGARNNIITSFSMSPSKVAKTIDRKVPSIEARLKAIEKLARNGHKIGIHFDPIIYTDQFEEDYRELLIQIRKHIEMEKIEYLSLGVVRFTQDVYYQVKKNYPQSIIHYESFNKSFDGKVRYSRPMRMWVLNKIKDMAISFGLNEDKIYLCME